MPDFDPDAYLKSTRQNKAPKDFDPDAYLKPVRQSNWDESALGATTEFAKGFGEGALGDVVGAGQIAEDIAPGLAKKVKSLPGVGPAAHWAKRVTTGPSGSWAESFGRFGGGAAPFMLAPELGGGALANVAARALTGAVAGGVQPTESGSLTSHAGEAAAGALAGGATAPAAAGKIARLGAGVGQIAGIEALARHLGIPPYWLAMGLLGHGMFWHHGIFASPLSKLAGKAATAAGKAVPAGATGAAAGEAAGKAQQAGESD